VIGESDESPTTFTPTRSASLRASDDEPTQSGISATAKAGAIMSRPGESPDAERLGEAAHPLRDQGADPFRVNAYRRAAATVRWWPQNVSLA
jgi:hypothetical protein